MMMILAILTRTVRTGGEATCTSRKKPKCASLRTPTAAPNIIAALISSSATGSVQLGESLST